MTILAEIYNGAADWLAEHEHLKGAHVVGDDGFPRSFSTEDVFNNRAIIQSATCACAEGAILTQIVKLDLPNQFAYQDLADEAFGATVGLMTGQVERRTDDGIRYIDLATYNDAQGRTKDEVVEVLRDLAAAWTAPAPV